MKTAADVRRYIEKTMLNMLERPDMYAANPEALESILSFLDGLRLEIQSPDREPDFDHGYGAYVMSKGYGVASFCYRNRRDASQQLSPEDKTLFKRLARFWARYLDSKFAMKRIGKR